MNQAFEVLPFGRAGMEGEMERSRMPRLGGKGGHVPFRARYGRRRYLSPPWPYYYGPYHGSGAAYVCDCPKCQQDATAFEVLPFG